jgi:hypothetical protein
MPKLIRLHNENNYINIAMVYQVLGPRSQPWLIKFAIWQVKIS